MTTGIKTIIYPVSDIERAKAQFTTLLGVAPVQDAPYYVGYRVDGQDIGLDPNGHAQGMTGPVAYVHVTDLDASLQALLDAGGQAQGEIREVGGGRRIVTVKDPDGNSIGILSDSK